MPDNSCRHAWVEAIGTVNISTSPDYYNILNDGLLLNISFKTGIIDLYDKYYVNLCEHADHVTCLALIASCTSIKFKYLLTKI